jgi:hypothetical protein
MSNFSNIYDEPPNRVRVKSRRKLKLNTGLVVMRLSIVLYGILLPFAIAAAWPTTTPAKPPPSDQQLDQVVMAIQSLATHREPVIRGREILKGFLYRWGNQ